ncbi:hypothetical protein [Jiella pacifica]|nr:hypothetical protein [Jiella pacifica]
MGVEMQFSVAGQSAVAGWAVLLAAFATVLYLRSSSGDRISRRES